MPRQCRTRLMIPVAVLIIGLLTGCGLFAGPQSIETALPGDQPDAEPFLPGATTTTPPTRKPQVDSPVDNHMQGATPTIQEGGRFERPPGTTDQILAYPLLPESIPGISGDGRFVVFDSGASNLVSGDTNETQDVFVHDRQTGQTERVSISSDGEQGNGVSVSTHAAISADGRFVAFRSHASNLVSGDTNGYVDIFVRDRQAVQTERVSISSDGEQADGDNHLAAISADGRFVAFLSSASNLVSGDTNGEMDIYVHDRQTGQTERVSISSAGEQGNGLSWWLAISADGRFVAFDSFASNLVSGDTNRWGDIFVHDRKSGQTERISISSHGEQANGISSLPAISADGRFVAFLSLASNLVSWDTNGKVDIFVHDRRTGQTERVSISSSGEQADGVSGWLAISADGRFVAFASGASNLVSGDTNGVRDVFIHDRGTGQTERVSLTPDGEQWSGDSTYSSISDDGRFIVYANEHGIFVYNR